MWNTSFDSRLVILKLFIIPRMIPSAMQALNSAKTALKSLEPLNTFNFCDSVWNPFFCDRRGLLWFVVKRPLYPLEKEYLGHEMQTLALGSYVSSSLLSLMSLMAAYNLVFCSPIRCKVALCINLPRVDKNVNLLSTMT